MQRCSCADGGALYVVSRYCNQNRPIRRCDCMLYSVASNDQVGRMRTVEKCGGGGRKNLAAPKHGMADGCRWGRRWVWSRVHPVHLVWFWFDFSNTPAREVHTRSTYIRYGIHVHTPSYRSSVLHGPFAYPGRLLHPVYPPLQALCYVVACLTSPSTPGRFCRFPPRALSPRHCLLETTIVLWRHVGRWIWIT